MEDITMDKLLNDLQGVIAEINKLVVNKDIEGARKVLSQIATLVAEQNNIPLDQVENHAYDHVLHQLLKNISGIIEISEVKEENPDISALLDELDGINKLLENQEPDNLREDLEAQVKKVDAKIARYQERLTTLRNAEVNEPLSIKDRNALKRDRDAAGIELDKARKRAQDKKAEIDELISKRDEEINKNNYVETREVVIDETPEDLRGQAEFRLKDYAERNGIDPSELRIVRSQIRDLDDGPKNTFQIVRIKRELLKALSDEQRAAYENEIAELEEKIANLSKPELDPELSKGANTLRKRADAHIAEIERLNAQIETIRNDKSPNKNNRIQALQKQINERQKAADKLYAQADEMLKRAGEKAKTTPEQDADRAQAEARLTELQGIISRDDNVRNTILPLDERKKHEEEYGRLLSELGLEGKDIDVTDEIKKALINAIKLEKNSPEEEQAKISALEGLSGKDLIAELDRLVIVLRDKIVDLNQKAYSRQENREADRQPYDDAKKQLETLKKLVGVKEILDKDDALIAKNPNVQEIDAQLAKANQELAELEADAQIKENAKKELDQKLAEDDAKRKYKSNLRSRIRNAEKGLEKAIAEKTALEERIAQIPEKVDREALLKRKAELEAEIKEKSAEKIVTTTQDRLDLGEEAAKIGDKIFKTAEIRRELTDRDITRDDFLQFYQAGRENTLKNIEEIGKASDEVRKEVGKMYSDPDSNKLLSEQMVEARAENNPEKLVVIYEKFRKNFLKNGKYNEQLEKIGLLNQEIKTPEDVEKMVEFQKMYEALAERELESLRLKGKDQQENLEIFEREIRIIEAEKDAIKGASINDIKAKSAEEKELRAKQIQASMFGDPDMKKEWDERMGRFHGHLKEEVFEYVDKDGNKQSIKYSTIDSYEGMEQDAYFLNLEDYRANLELVTKFRNSGNDISVLPPEMIKGKTQEQIMEEMADKAEYVASFHGLTNEHAVRYANLRTGGSTLKAMKPVRGELPTTTKMANAVENTFRFLGIRKPEFYKVNEQGEKVLDLKGGLTTLALDAALVGGIAVSTAVGGPIVLAGVGIGYAAKGAVLLGNLGAAQIEKNRFGEDISKNLPTIFDKAPKDAREVARKEYYREVEGMGKFTSWVKAKADRLPFFRDRAAQTEQAIVQDRIELSNRTIDKRDETAIRTVEENAKKADENQRRREENYKKEAQSDRTYNQMVSDPNSVDKDKAQAAIARNAALRSNGSKVLEDVNPDSKEPKKEQYIKVEEILVQTDELDKVVTEGGSIASTAVTEEQVYTGEMQRIDRWNKVATAILTMVGNIGLKAMVEGFNETEVIETKGPDQIVEKEVEVPVYEEVTTTEIDPSVKMSELDMGSSGKNDIYGSPSTGGATHRVDAAAAGCRDANGRMIEVSVAEAGKSFSKTHVHGLTQQDISNMSPEELIGVFKEVDSANLARYCEARGLPTNASDADIARCMLENGDLSVQSSSMEGWNALSPSNALKTTTQSVFKGMETRIETEVIPGEIIRQEVSKFSADKLIDATVDGAIIGAAAAGIDQAHEANKQTKKVEPGTHEQKTPSALISKIAKIEQEKMLAEQSREDNQNENEGHDEH